MFLFGQNGFSPLVVATREGHYEIVKALLEHREKPDLTTVSDTVCTSISLQYFVIILVSPSWHKGQNWPILMWSSQMKEVGKDYTKEEMTSNRLKITKALVEAGANINQEAHVNSRAILILVVLNAYGLSLHVEWLDSIDASLARRQYPSCGISV